MDERLFVESRFKDISIQLHEFEEANFNCSRIIITEKKMSFLTLPLIKDTIAIWGGGYAVRNLRNVEWLATKQIIYWGDIDTQGFEILSQLRGYFGQTISIMMDQKTFNTFELYHKEGINSRVSELTYLLSEEQELYNTVRTSNLRLEQERIPQSYVNLIIDEVVVKNILNP